MSASALLQEALGHAVAASRFAVRDLSEAEFAWEPVSPCWSVRPTAAGGWTMDETGAPLPTTIGWRLAHLVRVVEVYGACTFEGATVRWVDVAVPGAAAEAVDRLHAAQDRLVRHVAALGDDQLDEPRRAHWGEHLPAWQLVWTCVAEQLHHAAEIGVLRDLHRGTASVAPWPELQDGRPLSR